MLEKIKDIPGCAENYPDDRTWKAFWESEETVAIRFRVCIRQWIRRSGLPE